MDTLSRLLAFYPVRAALEMRCQLGAPWSLAHPAAAFGMAPYHLILNGSARLDIGNPDAGAQSSIELNKGDIVVFPKGNPHRLHIGDIKEASPVLQVGSPSQLPLKSNAGPGPVTDILCGQFAFLDGASGAMLAALPEIIVVRAVSPPDFAGLLSLISMLRIENASHRPAGGAVISQLSSALFSMIMRAWLEQSTSVSGIFALLAEQRLRPALQAILEDPAKAWSLNDMAETCHMSRATFARLFLQVSGATPATVLMQTRMAQAASWLTESRRAIAAIGEAVGYQSEAAFNRVFKRCFGIGPGQFRRNAHQAGRPDSALRTPVQAAGQLIALSR